MLPSLLLWYSSCLSETVAPSKLNLWIPVPWKEHCWMAEALTTKRKACIYYGNFMLWTFYGYFLCTVCHCQLSKRSSCGTSFLNFNTWLKQMNLWHNTRALSNTMKSCPQGKCYQRCVQFLSGFSNFSTIKYALIVMQQFCIRKSSITKTFYFRSVNLNKKTVITHSMWVVNRSYQQRFRQRSYYKSCCEHNWCVLAVSLYAHG